MAIYDKSRRSQAAKKGWVTRRNKAVESGKLSAEDFFEIYHVPYGSFKSENLFNYRTDNASIDLTTGEILEEYVNNEYDNEEFDYNVKEELEAIDNELLTIGEMADARLPSSLSGSQFATELNNTLFELINDIKRELDEETYYRFLANSIGEIDNYLSYYSDESNVYTVYKEGTSNLVPKIIDLAQEYGYNPSYDEWKRDFYDAMERDSRNYQKLHTRKRNRRKK